MPPSTPTRPHGDPNPPTPSTLLRALKNPNVQELAWFEFVKSYAALIRGFSLRIGVDPNDVDDVAQDVLVNVYRHIGEFNHLSGKCSFRTWLLNSVKWRVLDRQRRTKELPLHATFEQETAEFVWTSEWQSNLLKLAIQDLRKTLPAMQFQIFELIELKLVPKREVAERFQISIPQIYLINHRIRKRLKHLCALYENQLNRCDRL